MPVDMSKYPDNWKQIRHDILKRAGGTEPNPATDAVCEWCGAHNYEPHPETGGKVVLTIAHIHDPDPMNTDPKNLAALCQKCHNTHDAPMRARNRAERERQEQIEKGQMGLFQGEI